MFRFLILFGVLCSFSTLGAERFIPMPPNAFFETHRLEAAQRHWVAPTTKLSPGAAVALFGLQKSELNGLIGIVTSELNVSGRYPVLILRYSRSHIAKPDESEPFVSYNIKPENLSVLTFDLTQISSHVEEQEKLDDLLIEIAYLLKKPEELDMDGYQRAILDKNHILNRKSRAIGWYLWLYFGIDDMVYFIDKIIPVVLTDSKKTGTKRILEFSWHGIGTWQG